MQSLQDLARHLQQHLLQPLLVHGILLRQAAAQLQNKLKLSYLMVKVVFHRSEQFRISYFLLLQLLETGLCLRLM
jgi:hypothetical protein